ncbi:MAG: cohesin domain-containing protein, partial [Chloroflexota bacterium]
SLGRSSKNGVGQILIWGVILLQVIVGAAVLMLVSPESGRARQGGQGEALDVPPPVQVSEPPARLDETPPAEVFAPTPTATPIPRQAISQPTPFPEPVQIQQPATLRWRGLEITQGIQVFNEPEDPRCSADPGQTNYVFCNNSMPLVSGRHTLVRVYPACPGECPAADITVQLRLLKDGQEQASLTRLVSAAALQQSNSLSLPEIRSSLERSVNFEFFPAPDWMSGQVSFEVQAIAGGTAEPLTLSQNFAVRKPLRIAYLPIKYQGVTPPESTEMAYWLRRMYPVPNIEYYRLPVPDLTWEGDLDKSQILNKLLFTYWLYAQYQPVSEWPDQLFGWLPQEFFNGGVSDPFWCPTCSGPHSSRVAFGGLRPEYDIGGPRILVHEIAHNLGAFHAWSPTSHEDARCFKPEGADIRVDPDWPYAQTPTIQEFGVDLYSDPPIIYPPAYFDMMAYCTQPWISPHTYRKIFESPFLNPDVTATLPVGDFQPQAETGEGGTLLVSGVVYPDGTVSQPEIVRLAGDAFSSGFSPPVFTPPPGDDYCLEVQATDNTPLARRCFDAGFTDLETGQSGESSPYFFTLSDLNRQDIGRVSLSKNEVALVIVTPSNSPPDVALTFPNGGEVLAGQQTVTWEAYDADGDSLAYDLLYSADGGLSWLPLAVRLDQPEFTFFTGQVEASQTALIRIIASDGFLTNSDQSDAPFTLQAPAENSISLRGPTAAQAGQRFEVAVVANRVTEPGLFGVQFQLNFDPTRLQVQSLYLHPDLSLVLDETIDNGRGQISIVASRQGRVANLSGDLTLATVNFVAAGGLGETDVDVNHVLAGARGGAPLFLSTAQGLTLHIVH